MNRHVILSVCSQKSLLPSYSLNFLFIFIEKLQSVMNEMTYIDFTYIKERYYADYWKCFFFAKKLICIKKIIIKLQRQEVITHKTKRKTFKLNAD